MYWGLPVESITLTICYIGTNKIFSNFTRGIPLPLFVRWIENNSRLAIECLHPIAVLNSIIQWSNIFILYFKAWTSKKARFPILPFWEPIPSLYKLHGALLQFSTQVQVQILSYFLERKCLNESEYGPLQMGWSFTWLMFSAKLKNVLWYTSDGHKRETTQKSLRRAFKVLFNFTMLIAIGTVNRSIWTLSKDTKIFISIFLNIKFVILMTIKQTVNLWYRESTLSIQSPIVCCELDEIRKPFWYRFPLTK